MTDLRNLLRSAALFPRGGLDESVLAQRTRRRRRRRATVVASTSAAAIAALVGVVGVVAAGGDNSGSRIDVSSRRSAPSPDPSPTVAISTTTAGTTTSVPGSTEPSVSTPTTEFVTPGTIIVPETTIPGTSITATTEPTDTTQPATTTEPTTTVPPISGTGVVGRVTAGPTCPVEPPEGCPPNPVRDTAVQAIDGSGNVAGSDTTDANGNFAIALAPGGYTLHVATTSMFPSCPDDHITVTNGGPQHHDIGCDTGIR
jgi:hypothetical protein